MIILIEKKSQLLLNILIIFQKKLNYLVKCLLKIIKKNLRLKLREEN